jgi:hypothetical protein
MKSVASKKSANMNVLNIPRQYILERQKEANRDKYLEWLYGLPDFYIEEFVEDGLLPFLKEHGYKVGFSPEDCIRFCKQWAYALYKIQNGCNTTQEISYQKCAHNGGFEEFDWYGHVISPDDWYDLCETWMVPYFLDMSDAGFSQRTELPTFAWHLVDLWQSKSHAKWLSFQEETYESDDDHGHGHGQNEDVAYGGDRRTL